MFNLSTFFSTTIFLFCLFNVSLKLEASEPVKVKGLFIGMSSDLAKSVMEENAKKISPKMQVALTNGNLYIGEPRQLIDIDPPGETNFVVKAAVEQKTGLVYSLEFNDEVFGASDMTIKQFADNLFEAYKFLGFEWTQYTEAGIVGVETGYNGVNVETGVKAQIRESDYGLNSQNQRVLS